MWSISTGRGWSVCPVFPTASFETILPAYQILFGGPGAGKVASLLEHHHHAQFIPDTPASAIHLIPLAHERMERGLTEDLAYCEPFYLKEFMAGKPRVKGLGET